MGQSIGQYDAGEPKRGGPSVVTAVLLATAVWMALFILRMVGPSDLLDKDQMKPTAYTLDITQNGNWLSQHDGDGLLASKPPLYPWAAAIVSLVMGRVCPFTLYLPSALAGLCVALIVFFAGRTYFGVAAGLLAALAYLLSAITAKQMVMVRPDSLFAATTTLAALAAFRAWQKGRGWTLFWLAAAAATLAKGPLGLVLAAGGLLACLWERRSAHPAPIRGGHALGAALFLTITMGWLGLACMHEGWAVAQKLLGEQLLGHAISSPEGKLPGQSFYKQSLYFLSRFAPWSVFALMGFWRMWKRPANEDGVRRFERFIFCWFFAGLLIFSLATHQQADHLSPIIPAAALMAGRELSRLFDRLSPALTLAFCTLVSVVGLTAFALVYDVFWARAGVVRPEKAAAVPSLRELAEHLRQQVGSEFPFTYTGRDAFGLQLFLNTMRPRVSEEDAAELLCGDAPAFVVVRDYEGLQKALGPHANKAAEILRWPESEKPYIRIVSNHPRLEWTDRAVMATGKLWIQMDRVRLAHGGRNDFRFDALSHQGRVTFSNRAEGSVKVLACITGPRARLTECKILKPGEVWVVSATPGLY